MKIEYVLSIVLVLLLGASEALGQEVSGIVTDQATQRSIPGVNILVKGTSIGTASRSDGSFSLEVPSLQDTLVFSFVGYQTQEV